MQAKDDPRRMRSQWRKVLQPMGSLACCVWLLGGCEAGAEDPPEQVLATLSVDVEGQVEGTTEIEIAPGQYTIGARGRVEGDEAIVEIEAIDDNGETVARSQVRVPAAAAAGLDGDTGSGSVEAQAVAGEVRHVRLPVHWDGDAPDSGWNVEIDFGRDPDIRFWTVSPAPIIVANSTFDMTIGATNYAGAADELFFECWIGPDPCLEVVTYDADSDSYQGSSIAPDGLGLHPLIIDVSDDEGGSTQAGKWVATREGDLELSLADLNEVFGMLDSPVALIAAGQAMPNIEMESQDNNLDGVDDTIRVKLDGHLVAIFRDTDVDRVADQKWIDTDDGDGIDRPTEYHVSLGHRYDTIFRDTDGDGRYDQQITWTTTNHSPGAPQTVTAVDLPAAWP